MILKAAKKHNINLKQSWTIGDSKRDIKSDRRAGCNTILVEKNANIKNAINRIIGGKQE